MITNNIKENDILYINMLEIYDGIKNDIFNEINI